MFQGQKTDLIMCTCKGYKKVRKYDIKLIYTYDVSAVLWNSSHIVTAFILYELCMIHLNKNYYSIFTQIQQL